MTAIVRNDSGRRSIIAGIVLPTAACLTAVSAQAAKPWATTATLQGAAADPTVQRYIAEHRDTFAGEWVSTDSGHAVYNVGFTRDRSARAQELSALFAYPDQLIVQTERYSADDLRSVADAVTARTAAHAEQGFDVVMIGVDFASNTVAVGVAGSITEGQRYFAREFPDSPVHVRAASRLFTLGNANGAHTGGSGLPALAVIATGCGGGVGGLLWLRRRRRRADLAAASNQHGGWQREENITHTVY
jgi:hypothetical protein